MERMKFDPMKPAPPVTSSLTSTPSYPSGASLTCDFSLRSREFKIRLHNFDLAWLMVNPRRGGRERSLHRRGSWGFILAPFAAPAGLSLHPLGQLFPMIFLLWSLPPDSSPRESTERSRHRSTNLRGCWT